MILLLDNYDSFTYNLLDYIKQCGAQCEVLRNDAIALEEIAARQYKGIIISPGPETPSKAGITMAVIDKFHDKIPLLGVCLGHQAIGEFFGAKLTKAPLPVHGKTAMVTHTGHPLFNKIPRQFEVMRYHSLILTEVEQAQLQLIASTSDGIAMAIAHPVFPVVGVQFHPESILTSYGKQLIDNWLTAVYGTSRESGK